MRDRFPVFFSTVALPACALISSTTVAASQARPFTVEIMTKSEGIGEVWFSPKGDRLFVEKLAPYDTSPNFSWIMWNRERSALLTWDLGHHSAAKPVSSDGKGPLWLGSLSPEGTMAAVGWLDGDRSKAGIYSFTAGTLRRLDFLTSHAGPAAFEGPYWLSDSEFVHFAPLDQFQKSRLNYRVYTEEIASRKAKNSRLGTEPGVTVFRSGKAQDKAVEEAGSLLRVNARTGKSTKLSSGFFSQLSLSPDRRRFAALRKIGDLDLAGIKMPAVTDGTSQMELVVYDFSRGDAEAIPCKGCNVTINSLRWSPDGNKLFFAARVKGPGRFDHEYHIYDFRRDTLARFEPKSLAFRTSEESLYDSYVVPFVWLTDDTPAVRITTKGSPAGVGQKDRHDWYALPPGRTPVPLTSGLKSARDEKPLEDFVAVYKGKLLIMADGDLWQITSDGTRRNITQGIRDPLMPWCSAIAYYREWGSQPLCSGLGSRKASRPVDQGALAAGWLTFRILKDDVSTGDVLFLNIDNGKAVRIARPDPQAELVSASALAQAAVYKRKSDNGDRLLLVSANGATRELLHFNQHLAGVAGGKPVLLTRREPGEAEERYDWLLLPPNHKPGQRHPLLVTFYPGRTFTKELPSARLPDLRTVSFLNMHIPAARGYAVLLASSKISPTGAPSNPMTEMHEQLMRAAENAVQAGYADPERWALMGHSYGGYGTNSVVTQTNRFRAAVAMNGPANLTSTYSTGLGDIELFQNAFGSQWSENGQGRMGAAPWQDPQRYIANSPLFHVHRIETPLMLVHGNDDNVPVNESEQMFNALLRQGKDAMFVRYWGEGHFPLSPANIRDMWSRIFAWLDEHLDVKRDTQDNVMHAARQSR